MKKLFSVLLAAALLWCGMYLNTGAASHRLVSRAVVLMDADTGEVLWEKNMNLLRYPASITKIMTGLLVVEHCDASEVASVSAAAANIPRGYSHIALQAGDRITVEQAMYAMMLPSANDAAIVLAEHVGGSTSGFARLMNDRAREIGTRNTNFANPNGMPNKRHYTTAYDMALITREAVRHPEFMKYFSATSYTLPAFNSKTEEKEITGYQFMLLEDKDEYNPYVTGGKIGYTGEAGHTMSTVAVKDGRTLICVVMGSNRDGKYADTEALLNYGFSF